MEPAMKAIWRKWLHIVLGCLVTTAGLLLLKHSHIVTGGTAGLSLSLSYLFQTKFYSMFLLLNIPFILFSYYSIGPAFAFRTILSICLLTAMTSLDHMLPEFVLPTAVGSILGGALIGVGVSSLFKHGASLGGANILALFLQKKYGWDPGRTNFVFDCIVVLSSLTAISLDKGFFSIVSIAATSAVISYYKGRYQGARSVRTAPIPATVTA
ncbi:YitT family protein [Cohnella yongneupensis]|uniref:YitT family protein n=1 Tax=Cohnella yongneupensis TaxID=425006 RepID=A0ABW0R220_9BACL